MELPPGRGRVNKSPHKKLYIVEISFIIISVLYIDTTIENIYDVGVFVKLIDFITIIKNINERDAVMELRNLSTFIQVAELGSFTKAAQTLGFSQPTISFQIKQLESELGKQLFDRVGHTVSLTDGGREALVYAQKICRLAKEMVDGNSEAGVVKGVIRIAMADSLRYALIIEKFGQFRKEYPGIELKITAAGTDEMFRLLEHNEVDVVCTLDNHIYDATYVIANEEKVNAHFVCSVHNPLAYKKNLNIEEVVQQPFILTEKGMSYRRLMDEFLAEKSMEIHPVLEVGSADSICRLVKDDAGISFLPDYVTKEFVENKELVHMDIKGFHVELWKQILYHRDKWVSPQMQAVLEFVSSIDLG